ncbi:MAG: aquaporin [Deltaproteobacteria bacterium RIFCSPLOWO2_12_FULL_43_16]|nr:MAG: aquaporin [Deltaproteobacteria bacterium RIFCSPHIGHO2_02_FULL_43_33]OGQ59104.1 MAG: aquaporin [Deltaproteobacteria bacterium RIFCSPLOWO2_12_FULL_43_16]
MKKYLSELIGTYGLVFCGTGAIIINDITGGAVTHAGIAATFGLIVMAMIYAFGDISGAHINPAVTIAFWFSGRFPGKEVLPYAISQLIGALLASGTLKALFPGHLTLGATIPSGSATQSFFLELILTFFLMLVIINVSTGSKEKGVMAGIAIGSVVLLEAMFAGPICGASMNPARSIAPALLSGQIQHLWVYITAPLAGAALAILGCKGVKDKECCPLPSAFCKTAKN